MSRGHTPFGYRIENGVAVICEEEVAQIRKMYEGYLGGLSLVGAASAAGLKMNHASVKRTLGNPHYLGDEFYPAIIDKKTQDAFETERQRREEDSGWNRKRKTIAAKPAPTRFRMAAPTQAYRDPYQQAAYLYSLLESED